MISEAIQPVGRVEKDVLNTTNNSGECFNAVDSLVRSAEDGLPTSARSETAAAVASVIDGIHELLGIEWRPVRGVSIATPDGQASGLWMNSVVNCSQLVTVSDERIDRHLGDLPPPLMRLVDEAMKQGLALSPQRAV